MRGRVVAVVMSGFLASALVSACAQDNSPASPGFSFAEAPCPAPNVAAVGSAADLGPEFTCGYLTVPENRADPGSRTIRLAVARAKSASATPKPDPIVYLTGGPGGLALLDAVSTVGKGINRDRDVLFVSQRGNHHNDPFLSCPEYDAWLGGEALAMSFSDPAAGAKNRQLLEDCRATLAEGARLESYDTAENAADVADLRVALGIDEWNVYGVSYGTDLAQWLLRDHPDGIRSVVLDSVVPVQQNLVDNWWASAARSYASIFEACAAEPSCAGAYPDLRNEFVGAVNRLDAEPLAVTVDDPTGATKQVTIDGYTLANLIVAQSYTGPTAYAEVPRMIGEIARGDGRVAATALLARVAPPGLAGWGLAYGAYCREFAAWTDTAALVAAGRAALPDFPERVLASSPISGRVFDECGAWNVGSGSEADRLPAVSAVPTLLMGGTLDGVTALPWAEVVARDLANSQVVGIPGVGHDAFGQSECARTLTLDFIDDPIGPLDTSCTDTAPPLVFSVPAP